MKNVVLILPYFGKFKNYFPLFLKSCSRNQQIEWRLYTDNQETYPYPPNVKVIHMSFENWRSKAREKFDFDINMAAPYKLCDYKPTYGYLVEEEISNFDYWGYCDCDLIFGNLCEMLMPILEHGYDKIFAAGHLTLYKNTFENNRRFMKPIDGREIYKEAFSVREIKAFDEDLGTNNIHEIFLQDGATIFAEDYSINPNVFKSFFQLMCYDPQSRSFIEKPYRDSAYYWHDGHIWEIWVEGNQLKRQEYLYMHLQMRNMVYHKTLEKADTIQILPNEFRAAKLPTTVEEFKKVKRKKINRQQWDLFMIRVKRKLGMFH